RRRGSDVRSRPSTARGRRDFLLAQRRARRGRRYLTLHGAFSLSWVGARAWASSSGAAERTNARRRRLGAHAARPGVSPVAKERSVALAGVRRVTDRLVRLPQPE